MNTIEILVYTHWDKKWVLLPEEGSKELDFYSTTFLRVKADVVRILRVSPLEADWLRNSPTQELISNYI